MSREGRKQNENKRKELNHDEINYINTKSLTMGVRERITPLLTCEQQPCGPEDYGCDGPGRNERERFSGGQQPQHSSTA